MKGQAGRRGEAEGESLCARVGRNSFNWKPEERRRRARRVARERVAGAREGWRDGDRREGWMESR